MSAPFIYLDNNATTRIDPSVVEAMLPFLTEQYGNPSSAYRFGKQADEAIEQARNRVAALLNCEASEVLFTSSGTEATNAAIYSALSVDPDRQHVVTTRVEHSATIKACERHAKKGGEVTWLGVDEKGQLRLEELEKAIRPDTALVSVMMANNETGTLFPIEEVQKITSKKGVYFHCDAVQAVAKESINLQQTPMQFVSVSGHKLHCPKGVGALIIHRKTRFLPYLVGGGQEGGKRGGTQNVASIVAFGKACELASGHVTQHRDQMAHLRDRFETELMKSIDGISINGDANHRLTNTTNLSFENVDGEMLLALLDKDGVYCSAGSACTSGSLNPSHVLKAMGCSDQRAKSSLRFSFSKFNDEAEIDKAISLIQNAVGKLRER